MAVNRQKERFAAIFISKGRITEMTELNEKLFTPKELDEKKILSLVQQWKERKEGRLNCYRIGRKILYSEKHIADYLALCETNQESEVSEK
jgi:hypothetical protein